MITFYKVRLEIFERATIADVLKLKDHLKTLKIEAVGLDRDDFKTRPDELSFTIYGELGPYMMNRMVRECIDNIFPGSALELSQKS